MNLDNALALAVGYQPMSDKPPQKSAILKAMDYLAIRSHSRSELFQKLAKSYSESEAEAAVLHAENKGWLQSEKEVAAELIEQLKRKGKGLHFINAKLEEKGLPPLSAEARPSDDEELEKAAALVENKFGALIEINEATEGKIGRFLESRGFDIEIVRKVLYEQSKKF